MHIKLVDLQIDNLSVDEHWLARFVSLSRTDNDEIVKSNYWGFNGQVCIDFNEENSFLWIASTKKY